MPDNTLSKEEAFHDDWARSVDPATIQVGLDKIAVLPEIQFLLNELKPLEGKNILDIGCGCGEASVFFARQGAVVTASDLSADMLELTARVAALHGVSVTTCKSDASAIQFPDESFDIIYMANLLHHVNIEETITGVYRMLKPGGTFASWDPIKYNPVINVYRKIASEVRTEDEHPLGCKDLLIIKSRFKRVKTSFFWFTSLAIFLKYYFMDRVDPNKERYWKKITTDKDIERSYKFFSKVDKVLLKIFPPLKWLCWNIAIAAVK